MTGRRIKQTRTCSKEGCNRLIRSWNKSGLCHHHYKKEMKKKLEKRWRKEHKCFDCPSRVEPIIIYPAGNTIPLIKNYPIRCYECRKKILLKLKMNSKKQRINSSYSELNISKNSKRHRDKKKALKICVNCPNYLEPIITYPAGDKTPPIISYPIRCYKCRKKHNSRGKIYKMKKEINNNK